MTIGVHSPLVAATPSVSHGATRGDKHAMAFIPATNTIKAEMVYNHIGQICENVFYAKMAGAVSLTDLTDLAGTLVNWFDTQLQPLVSNGTALTKVLCRDMTVESGAAIEFTTDLPMSGTGGSALPGNVTVASKWSTGLAGRSFRGRTYLVGLPVGNNTTNANLLDAGYLDDLQDAYEALIADISVDDRTFVVASFFHDNAPRTEAVLTEIIAVAVNNQLDSQRRRLAGRGS